MKHEYPDAQQYMETAAIAENTYPGRKANSRTDLEQSRECDTAKVSYTRKKKTTTTETPNLQRSIHTKQLCWGSTLVNFQHSYLSSNLIQ
jgi:hypothetical protein